MPDKNDKPVNHLLRSQIQKRIQELINSSVQETAQKFVANRPELSKSIHISSVNMQPTRWSLLDNGLLKVECAIICHSPVSDGTFVPEAAGVFEIEGWLRSKNPGLVLVSP